MNHPINPKFIHISLGLLAFWVLIPYVFTGFASADDIQYSLNALNGGIWDLSVQFAKDQGRFHFLFSSPAGHFAYIFHNLLISKLINILLIFSNIILISVIIRHLLKDKWTAYLVFLFIVVFITGKGIYNPLVCYPTYFSGSFSLLLLSLFFAIKYAQTYQNRFRYFSAIIYAVTILYYESYILYFPVIALLLCYFDSKPNEQSFWQQQWGNIKTCLPHIIVVLLYLTAYVGFRFAYPSHYGGASIAAHFSILNVTKAVLNFATGAYPLLNALSKSHTVYGSALYFKDSFSHILYFIFSEHFEWIVKSIVVGFLVSYFMKKSELQLNRRFLIIFCISFLYIFIPHIPLALTEKYLEYGGFANYVTTYFAFYAVMICTATTFIYLFFKIKQKHCKTIYVIVLSMIIGLASIINDYANYHTVKYLRKSMHTMTFMSKISNTPEYKALPDKTFIFAPQLYNNFPDIMYIFSQGFNWSTFCYLESGRKDRIISSSAQELVTELKNSSKTPYVFTYGRNQNDMDQYIAMAKISALSKIDTAKQTFVTDTAIVYYYSNNKTFSLSFRTLSTTDSIAIINGTSFIVHNNNLELEVENKIYKNQLMRISINAKSIDVKSISVSNNGSSNGYPLILE